MVEWLMDKKSDFASIYN